MNTSVIEQYTAWRGHNPKTLTLLPASGSHRKYYRIEEENGNTLLGVYNDNVPENEAYLSFSKQFEQQGLPVPAILHVSPDPNVYFVQDLGDATLFSLLPAEAWGENPQAHPAYPLYEKVIAQLIRFQTSDIQYDKVYPVANFDHVSMMWDLNYFKYFFLRLSGIEFSETRLEDDFRKLCTFLHESKQTGFLYRDFQSRNIMIYKDEPWFIDFQGGRKGPLGYDLASLLYDAKANLPVSLRKVLLEKYMERAGREIAHFDKAKFLSEFYACVLLRILQAMGTYGLRGLHERKDLFLKSIPYAVRNLNYLRTEKLLPFPLPELERILEKLAASPWASFSKPASEKLHVEIYSFSVRDTAAPLDPEHGGGFVFDCRFLPNPGRLPEYKNLTGRSPEVIHYLQNHVEVGEFLQNCLHLLKPAILNYIARGFEHLSVSFGCTGGQHRSVYCAETLAKLISQSFDVKVSVKHLVHPE